MFLMNQTSTSARKLPPFAKRLIKQQGSGRPITNDVFIFIGGYLAYLKAKAFWYSGNTALIYHPDDPPGEFFWPVEKQSVLIFDLLPTEMNIQQLKLLALVLLNSGALVVRYIDLQGRILKFIGGANEHPTH